MNHGYLEEYRNLRDDFKRFQQLEVVKGTMDTAWNGTWLRGLSPTTCEMLGTNDTEAGTQTSSTSSYVGTRIGTPSAGSSTDIVRLQIRAEESYESGVESPRREGEDNNDAPQNPRPRKGHKKSRQGCYNCKRRKIKCQESQPGCENCTRKHLQCKYPSPKTLSGLQVSAAYSASPIATISLQSTPTTFTLTDMRLFHHFLMFAYPHLPVGNDSAWQTQVPLIAHHNEYLMHAILGMAASHLQLSTGQNLHGTAMHHRILAIKGSNEAISRTPRKGADGDALLGACYALTFQSAYMPEGLPDFFQMVRGCSILSHQLKSENLPMAFFLEEKDHFSYMSDRLLDLPTIDPNLVDGAYQSLASLPILFDRPAHVEFYKLLIEVIDSLKLSSLKAYFSFIRMYHGIIQMDTQGVEDFVDPCNHVSQILIGHFLAIQTIVSPIIDREWSHRTRSTPLRSHLDWINTIHDHVPEKLRQHMQWPKFISNGVNNELLGRQLPGPSILRQRDGYGLSYF